MTDRARESSTTMAITGTHGPECQRGVAALAVWEHLPRRHTERAARFVSVCPVESHPCWNPTHHTCCLAAAVVTVYRGRLCTTASRERPQERRGSKATEEG